LSFALMLVVPGLLLLGLVAAYAGTAVAPHGGIFRVLQWVLVVALGFSAATGVLVLIYVVFPRRRLPWRQVWRGAVTAATGITVLSFGYVVFLRVGVDFEKRYATSGLAAIVLLAFWLFLANGLVLVGYEVARET
jgi:membrane protein